MKKSSSVSSRVAAPRWSTRVAPSAISAGGSVADRRSVGDVAADGADVAHLLAGEPAHQLAEIGIDRREVRQRRRVGRGCAEGHRARIVDDRIEAGDPAEPDDLGQIAQLLGDPQPDIGRARDEDRVRILGVERGQGLDARRGGEEALRRADHDVGLVVEVGERAGDLRLLVGEAVAPGAGAGGERGIDDRTVAGAAAQVPGDPVVHGGAGDGPACGIMEQREQRHHEAGRAEAALGAVEVDHRLLHRMQAVGREVVDRDHVAAVGLPGEHDAGIHGGIDQPLADPPPQHHRAGAAVALRASLLGPHRPLMEPQIIEEGQRRGHGIETHERTPPQERDVATHDVRAPPATH